MKPLNFIIPIWKNIDWTSNDVLKYIKPIIRPTKIGHAGTLDPFAEGILIICLGKSTKSVSTFMDYEKEYWVEIKLGERTDTLDCTGAIVKRKIVKNLKKKKINSILNTFEGHIQQIPPMYSAIKINGQRLYKYARQGIKIDRKAREVYIKKIEFIDFVEDCLRIKVTCGKGTYIRALARDIAIKLGTEGHVRKLIRTKIGIFDEKTSIEVKDFRDWLLLKKNLAN